MRKSKQGPCSELVGYIFWSIEMDLSKHVLRAYTNKGTLYLRAQAGCCADCFIQHVTICNLIGEKIVSVRLTGDLYGDFVLIINTRKGTSTIELRTVDSQNDPGAAYQGDIDIDRTTDYSRHTFKPLEEF